MGDIVIHKNLGNHIEDFLHGLDFLLQLMPNNHDSALYELENLLLDILYVLTTGLDDEESWIGEFHHLVISVGIVGLVVLFIFVCGIDDGC